MEMKSIINYCKNNKNIAAFLEEYGPQLKKAAVICLIGMVLFAGFSLFRSADDDLEIASDANLSQAGEDSEDQEGAGTRTSSADVIYVDVGGAVKSPMLAELPDGSRVDDAIRAAGGLKQEADMTSINRAEFLTDGQKVFIPSFPVDEDGNVIVSAAAGSPGAAGGSTDAVASAGSGSAGSSGKININTADSTQLQSLSGVGPATAQKIIDYRQSNGSFSSVEDIKNVSGIGDKTYEKLKDSITI